MIGNEGNVLTTVTRNINGIELGRVYVQGILSALHPTKLVIEVTVDGTIQVYTSNNPFLPLISVKDVLKPIQVNYISFASPERSLFFYDTDEESIAKMPMKLDDSDSTLEMTQLNVKHPLLAERDYPIGLSDLCKLFLLI